MDPITYFCQLESPNSLTPLPTVRSKGLDHLAIKSTRLLSSSYLIQQFNAHIAVKLRNPFLHAFTTKKSFDCTAGKFGGCKCKYCSQSSSEIIFVVSLFVTSPLCPCSEALIELVSCQQLLHACDQFSWLKNFKIEI